MTASLADAFTQLVGVVGDPVELRRGGTTLLRLQAGRQTMKVENLTAGLSITTIMWLFPEQAVGTAVPQIGDVVVHAGKEYGVMEVMHAPPRWKVLASG